MDAGASLAATDKTDKTPLHWLSQHGCAEAITLALRKGADANATDGSLRQWDLRSATPEQAAVEHAHDDAVAGLQLDETKALTSSFDSTVKIWDLRMGLAPRATLHTPGGTRCTRLAYDDTRIVTGSLNSSIVCLDLL